MKQGKINKPAFENIFTGFVGEHRDQVLTGPAFGVDVAVIDLGGNQAIAATSDPLSYIPSLGLRESAWLSVHLIANDMATTGFGPQFAQFVLNLPADIPENDFITFWRYIHQFCKECAVSITGGHTAFVEGLESTLAGGGTFFTVAEKSRILTSDKAEAGNLILMTKEAAISSMSILARSFPDKVSRELGPEILDAGRDLFDCTTALAEGLIAGRLNQVEPVVTAMHDVTEGGVLGAVYEMAEASGNGVILYEQEIAVGKAVREIAGLFSLDPLYCIGAGSMLMAVEKGKESSLIRELAESGIQSGIIGQLIPAREGRSIVTRERKSVSLNYPEKDPYWDAFYQALNEHWH
jgi:hydrogenase maturation factor